VSSLLIPSQAYGCYSLPDSRERREYKDPRGHGGFVNRSG